MSAPAKVVVLGGGVAGLSAAHELVERGFRVEVYEAQGIPGGKARSIDVPRTGSDGRKDLPGEHGFRFFPGFYRHIIDTMGRIPYGDGATVVGNLEETTRIALARYDQPPLIMNARFPRQRSDVRVLLRDLLDRSVNISRADKEFFAARMWQVLTSCEERRLDEYEKLGWWDFIGAAERSAEYQKYLCYGLTRTLVAAQPRRASTKTGANILLQLIIDMLEPTEGSDRVLNGPTNEVWIEPWLDYLRQRGVAYHLGARVTAITCANGVITGATIRQGGRSFEVTGDYFLAALPVERMAPLISDAMMDVDPRLEGVKLLQRHVHMMNGIQFYLREDFPLVHGHTIYIDSAWAITSISQKQFWPRVDLADYGDGATHGIISVDISEWNEPGKTNGKTALESTPEEIAHEVWEEIKHAWPDLTDEHLQSWFLDPDISPKPMKHRDKEYLLVNEINTWGLRPNAFTRIPNLFLASDYIRTNTDLATMEGANEAARRAVNSIIDAAGSSAPYCRVWKLHEPALFAPWRAEDRDRYALGLPWNGKPDWEEFWRYHRLARPLNVLTNRLHGHGAAVPTEIATTVRAVESAMAKVLHRVVGGGSDDTPVATESPAEPEPSDDPEPAPQAADAADAAPTGRGLRIAVLGGGMGSLAAVCALTDPANPARERIEKVTVYQLGWRLGGKGASGRGEFDRIEEHGLHIWIGFYQNAFRLIRQVYEELGRPAGSPLATWDAAFKKHSLWVVDEHIDGQWKHWPFTFPTDDATPGTGGVLPSPHEYLELALNLLRELFHRSPHATAASGHQDAQGDGTHEGQGPGVSHGHGLLDHAHQLATRLRAHTSHAPKQEYEEIGSRLQAFSAWLGERRSMGSGEHDEARRLHILVELVASSTRGLIHDVLLTGNHDLDALDGEDFRDWLKRHGAPEEAYNSAAVRGFLYDLAFAYRNGDTSQPSFAAGTALRCALRVLFTYRGAVFWKMQAGMGDTIFAPIYEVLRARGVDFKFFHAVRNVGLSADRSSVATIEVGRQATLKSGEYQPLRDVNGLPCWPSEPDYGQLAEGDELRADGIDLESFWTPWQDRERIVLQAGQDFDVAILGVPLGSHPSICPELVEASPRWKDMVEKVETTRTQAFQLWMRPSLAELGWSLGSPVLDAYAPPLNTWADMSQLVQRESWPHDNPLGSIAYFCGPMQGGIPDPGDVAAPERERARVKEAARDVVTNGIAPLWPRAVDGGSGQSMNWDLLLGPDGTAGEARFDAQFFRANIDPSERYVLAVVDSSKYRLGADESGFANLVLAGDWTKNGINAGCVEAAVMSGLLAAHAVCGYPSRDQIIGLDHL